MKLVRVFVHPRTLYAEFGCEGGSVDQSTSGDLTSVVSDHFGDAARDYLDVAVIDRGPSGLRLSRVQRLSV
jgi:hypothetical protein